MLTDTYTTAQAAKAVARAAWHKAQANTQTLLREAQEAEQAAFTRYMEACDVAIAAAEAEDKANPLPDFDAAYEQQRLTLGHLQVALL